MSRRISFEAKMLDWAETQQIEVVGVTLGMLNSKAKQRIREKLSNKPPEVGVGGVTEVHTVLLSTTGDKKTRKYTYKAKDFKPSVANVNYIPPSSDATGTE